MTRTKSRINQLLHVLQNISQIQKLSKLETLYGSPVSKGFRASNPSRKEAERKRTRSTGAVKMKKVTEKRTKAMTINLV